MFDYHFWKGVRATRWVPLTELICFPHTDLKDRASPADSAGGWTSPLAPWNPAVFALVSHTLLPLPKLPPEETPAVPAGSSLSQSAVPPGGLQHRGAGISTTPSLLLKIESVNETYHTKYWTSDTADCTEFYA